MKREGRGKLVLLWTLHFPLCLLCLGYERVRMEKRTMTPEEDDAIAFEFRAVMD